MKFEFRKICRECKITYYKKEITEDQFCDLRDSKLPEVYDMPNRLGWVTLYSTCGECSDRHSERMGL